MDKQEHERLRVEAEALRACARRLRETARLLRKEARRIVGASDVVLAESLKESDAARAEALANFARGRR